MIKSNQDDLNTVSNVPGTAARKTQQVFNIEKVYLTVGDSLDQFLECLSFCNAVAANQQGFNDPTRLALMTVFQFAEDLADRPACAAVSRRLDWRYALRLPPRCPELEPGLLCSFRQLLIGYPIRLQEFQCLLDRCAAAGLLGRGKRDIQAGEVVDYVCRLNQLERVHEALSQAIGALACHQPEMLRAVAQPHWYHRYQGREGGAFDAKPDLDHRTWAQALGADARHLLDAIAETGNSAASNLPEVRQLSSILKYEYQLQGTTLTLRDVNCRLCPWLAEGILAVRSSNQTG